MRPCGGEDETEREAKAQEAHGDLVHQADAGHQTEDQPDLGVIPCEGANRDPGEQGPEEDVEDVHGKEMPHREIGGHAERCDGGEQLGSAAAPHRSCDQARDEDRGCAGQRRQKTDGEQRITEECTRQREQCDRERWMLDVTPGQMVGGSQVVEFVANETVSIGRGQVKTEFDCRDPSQGNQRTSFGRGLHAD